MADAALTIGTVPAVPTGFPFGLEEISAAHDGRGLVLLCFEPVGEPCHRHLFASWFEQQTGQNVPELEPTECTFRHLGGCG